MRKMYVVMLFSFYFISSLSALTRFAKNFGGSDWDEIYSLVSTSDGGYVTVGMTRSFGSGVWYDMDILVVKFDSVWNPIWNRLIGGDNTEQVYSIIQTFDGGYAIAGGTNSYGASTDVDFFIIKLDSLGSLEWTRIIGGSGDDMGVSIIQMSDKGYLVGGWTESFTGTGDILLIKLDSIGNLVWSKLYGGSGGDWFQSMTSTYDGGYVIAGNTTSFNSTYDALVIKLDSLGNVVWAKAYDEGEMEVISGLIQTTDGGYAIAGFLKAGPMTVSRSLVMKIDSIGNFKWAREVTGGDDENYALVQTQNKDYFAVGYTVYYDYFNLLLSRFDSSGNFIGAVRLVGSQGYNLINSPDGHGVIAGGWYKSLSMPQRDFYIVKFDNTGSTCWGSYAGVSSYDRFFDVRDISITPQSVSPNISTLPPINDTISNLPVNTLCEDVLMNEPVFLEKNRLIYVNSIFNDRIHLVFSSFSFLPLKINIYDIKGSSVYEKDLEYTPHTLLLQDEGIRDLAKGIYFLDILIGQKRYKKLKIIKH